MFTKYDFMELLREAKTVEQEYDGVVLEGRAYVHGYEVIYKTHDVDLEKFKIPNVNSKKSPKEYLKLIERNDIVDYLINWKIFEGTNYRLFCEFDFARIEFNFWTPERAEYFDRLLGIG